MSKFLCWIGLHRWTRLGFIGLSLGGAAYECCRCGRYEERYWNGTIYYARRQP